MNERAADVIKAQDENVRKVVGLIKGTKAENLLEKFNSFHDERGRFTTATGGAATMTLRTGGSSTSTSTGSSPKDGFMVAADNDRERVIEVDLSKGSAGLIPHYEQYLKDNADILSQPDKYFGTWVDKSSGKLYLDVSTHVRSREEAVKLGNAKNQIAIWDVVNGEEVRLR